MDYSLIRVRMEQDVGSELYSLIDGEIIEYIIDEGKIGSQKDVMKMIHQGQTLSVSERLTPDLYNLCENVKIRLHFEENIDFYIVNSPEINAYAIAGSTENQSNIVAINSGLIERFDEEELKFIIGHEIGHLISGSAKLDDIIRFVFPEGKKVPLAFENKWTLWKSLSELTADRYGFIASPNVDVIAGGFFKMASGLNANKFSFSPAAYLEEIEKTLDYFTEQPFSILGSHPINPVRIKAIQLFSESDLYKAISVDPDKLIDDEKLHEKTDDLISVLLSIFESEFDMHVANFIAASGIIIAAADDDISNIEIDAIVEELSKFTIFPKKYLEAIIEDDNIPELLRDSITAILEDAPEDYPALIGYLMTIVMADNKFEQQELERVLDIAENYIGISRREAVRIIGDVIQSGFMPRMYLA